MPAKLVERWLRDLEGEEPERRSALDGLYGLGPGDREAVAALVSALESGAGEVPVQAARFLGLIGPGASDAVPALLDALDHESRHVCLSSADALGRIGPAAESAVDRLRELAQEEDPWVRLFAQGALLKLCSCPELVATLARTRVSDDIALQCWGLGLLIDVIDKYEGVFAALLGYLPHHYDPHIEDIGTCLAHRPGTRTTLLLALTFGADLVRWNAASILGRQHPPAEELVAPLAMALRDSCDMVAWRAAGALTNLHRSGTDVRCALPEIQRVADGDTAEAGRVCRDLLAELAIEAPAFDGGDTPQVNRSL